MNPIDPVKAEFAKALFLLAKECGKELSDDLVDVYAAALAPMGFDNATMAIKFVLINRRSNEPFPTPRELMDAIPSDDAMCPDTIANRMAGAITKFGSYNYKDAQKYIGEAGWKIICESGGWSQLCMHSRPDQMPILKSQWRKQLEAMAARERTKKMLESTRVALNTGRYLPGNCR